MKITIEDTITEDIELIIRGNIQDPKLQKLISIVNSISDISTLILWDGSKEVVTRLEDVYYFTVENRHVYALTTTGRLICKYSLNEILTIFSRCKIVQASKATLVNVNHIISLEAEFSGNYILTLDNGEKILASRFYMKNLRKTIMEV